MRNKNNATSTIKADHQNHIKYTIKTNAGKFLFKFVPTFDRNTNKLMSFNINLGSDNRFCVQLNVPSKESNKTDANLMWVEAHEECSMEQYIKKGLAKQMVLLGLTLTRKLNPNIKTVSFEDTSSFKCKLPDGKEQQVPMKAFHIAFYEATWYEYYFGARLKTDYDDYCIEKKNMYKSENKPKRFDFINPELQKELEPLYESTSNWYDFFQAISKKYGDKKCTMIYPWISRAMSEIFVSRNYYDSSKWYIDFKLNEEQNKTPLIDFDMTVISKLKGGKRTIKTLKNRHARRFTYTRTHMFPNIPEIQKLNYKKFLKSQ
jgi:hypothetical protein